MADWIEKTEDELKTLETEIYGGVLKMWRTAEGKLAALFTRPHPDATEDEPGKIEVRIPLHDVGAVAAAQTAAVSRLTNALTTSGYTFHAPDPKTVTPGSEDSAATPTAPEPI